MNNTSPGDDSAGNGLEEGMCEDAASAYESDSSMMDSDGEADDCQLSVELGRGVRVVRAGGRDADGAQFEPDEAALAELLLRPGVASRPVALVSVAGAFRGGKSFLLNFMLRYLYAEESARADGSWLGAPGEPLRGFSWRAGCQRDTSGLVVWSQPFRVTLPDGQKVVVLLMDTQGSFDDASSMRDCSLIFALSTLLSSVQVYNLSQRINESDLQHLQLFTDHAAAGGGALQTLQLLVRDWSAPGDFPYGAAGGADYLRHKLQMQTEQPLELREVRERLSSSFERVECCLLPYPGLRAATDPAFSGQLAGNMTEEFKASLLEFVPLLLAPSRLRVKAVGGRVLRARDLALHLRAYLDTFRHHVPSPMSIGRAIVAARWLAAAAAARAQLRAHAPARATPARPRAELRESLAAARRAAAVSTEPLAARSGDEKGFANLEKELDEQVAQYIDENEKKIALGVASARERWEELTAALRSPALCATERNLREDEAAARAAAAARFDERVAGPEEPERAQLIQQQ
ncbi:atlastin-like [Cydia amplana]|uniref:atlastin-like n=1 Tax=Cydia amplana TaxID=1869771 RepID=UPI002FE65AB4